VASRLATLADELSEAAMGNRTTCVVLVTHVVNPPVKQVFERLQLEAPPDHVVHLILNSDETQASLFGIDEDNVTRITTRDLFALSYSQKCRTEDWQMAGNLDLAFLVFRRAMPQFDHYWFVEYDVHWEGNWKTFFQYFQMSDAAVLAATVQRMDEVPHKENSPPYPKLVVPPGLQWIRQNVLKAFLPICRISGEVLDLLDAAYRQGLGAHYEVSVPSVAAQNGLSIEDYGGNGRYVRPENVNRFYFARGATYSHSPGNFVFRPAQKVLRRANTLWHPVKPPGVAAWHPMRIGGSPAKRLLEFLKPGIWRAAVWIWFALRWRPLPQRADLGAQHVRK
jgi:hypothetical protein